MSELWFLVDTGADSTLPAPGQATRLGIGPPRLRIGGTLVGVGGTVNTRYADCVLILEERSFRLGLRILAPSTDGARRAMSQLPSVLGRDVLSRFALFLEERTQRVLLLDPEEADRLPLP